jgi:hypothetical protein
MNFTYLAMPIACISDRRAHAGVLYAYTLLHNMVVIPRLKPDLSDQYCDRSVGSKSRRRIIMTYATSIVARIRMRYLFLAGYQECEINDRMILTMIS